MSNTKEKIRTEKPSGENEVKIWSRTDTMTAAVTLAANSLWHDTNEHSCCCCYVFYLFSFEM